MNNITYKSLTVLFLLATLSVFCGCVSIKQADIKEANFNTAGWKSQAGVSGDATIEATTAPTTDVSAAGL